MVELVAPDRSAAQWDEAALSDPIGASRWSAVRVPRQRLSSTRKGTTTGAA